MHSLVLNILRGVKKRLFQYVGIALLIIIIVATMTGLYGSSDRSQAAFAKVEAHSGTYDYRIQIENLSDFKDSDASLARIKDKIKSQFSESLLGKEYQEIIRQIDNIKITDVQNRTLPNNGININKNLKDYLLNWGSDYKAILLNDILNEEAKSDPSTSKYKITSSFLKSFSYKNKEKKLFFTFEDAFYLKNNPENLDFAFSPTRNGSNEVYIVEGRKPIKTDEIVINPTFAKKNNISLNSVFPFYQHLKVVGFGYTYWGIIPALSFDNIDASPKNTTPVFATREWINEYLYNNSVTLSSLSTPYFLRVGKKDAFFQDKMENIFNKIFNFNFGTLIILDSEDLRSGSIRQTYDMQNIVYSAISFIVLLAVIFIVISYVKKEIDLQKKQIGVIKALGYNNYEISFGFTFLFFLLSICSTSLGFFLGLFLQLHFNFLSEFGFFLPEDAVYFSLISLIIGVFVTTIIFTFASYLQAYKNLAKDPLLLIYDRSSNISSKLLAILKKPFNYWKFKPRLAVSFALKSVGKLTLIFFIFIFAIFLLMFENIAVDIFNNKIGTFYGHLNKEIYYQNKSSNMYKFNSNDNNEPLYNWIAEKEVDKNKKLTADTFHIDSHEKCEKLITIMKSDNYKGYFIKSSEMMLLYENTQNFNNCFDYIRPPGTDFISKEIAGKICYMLKNIFDFVITTGGINPKTQKLPGFSMGQNILDSNYYPNLDFNGTYPMSWQGENQGSLISKRANITTLYNSSDSNNPVTWKSWFNMKEEKGYDIDSVFNSSHELKEQEVVYIDGFGRKNSRSVYVVPAVISKTLATLNKYKVGNQVLIIINDNSRFIPVIFDIKGITTTNLDTSVYYANIDDLRKVVGYPRVNNVHSFSNGSFNNFYSKDSSSILPLNSINLIQEDGDYSIEGLKKGLSSINKIPIIMPWLKERLVQVFGSVKTIIEITKWLTIIALTFVLVIIINMILDNNLLIIAMMKALGYRINEINLLIIGSYIFTLLIAFLFGTVLSYVTWGIILWVVANLSNVIFLMPISVLTIFLSFLLIFIVIIIGYVVGLYFIKFKPVSTLLQSD